MPAHRNPPSRQEPAKQESGGERQRDDAKRPATKAAGNSSARGGNSGFPGLTDGGDRRGAIRLRGAVEQAVAAGMNTGRRHVRDLAGTRPVDGIAGQFDDGIRFARGLVLIFHAELELSFPGRRRFPAFSFRQPARKQNVPAAVDGNDDFSIACVALYDDAHLRGFFWIMALRLLNTGAVVRKVSAYFLGRNIDSEYILATAIRLSRTDDALLRGAAP